MDNLERAKKALAWLDTANEEGVAYLGTQVCLGAIAYSLIALVDSLENIKRNAFPVEIFGGN